MGTNDENRKQLKLKLEEIFSLHPKDNLGLDETKGMFSKLRDLSTNMTMTTSSDPYVVQVVGTEYCVKYFVNCLDMISSELSTERLVDFRCPLVTHFIVLQMAIWNVTDKSSDVCSRLVLVDAHRTLWKFISEKKLRASFSKFGNASLLVICSLGILHNVLRHTPRMRDDFRDCGGVDILQPYVSDTYSTTRGDSGISLQTAALFILACIVNENENTSIITTDRNVLDHVLAALCDSLRSPPDYYSTSYGYHAAEIFACLNCLAGNDENKRGLLDHNALELISDALKISINVKNDASPNGAKQLRSTRNDYRFSADDLAKEAIDLLWHLSFLKEAQDHLKETSELYKLCQQCNGVNWNAECRKSVQALLSSLSQSRQWLDESGNLNTSSITASPKPQGHIMISYNNTSQALVAKLKEALTSRGWNVWIYTEHCSELRLSPF